MAARRKWAPGTPFQRSKKKKGGKLTRPTKKLPPGVMNKSEERYAADVLELRRLAGEILVWQYQPVRLRLARESIFTPDFGYLTADQYTLVDFKGHQEEAALVRIKIAASLYWWWGFEIAKKIPRKEGGGYHTKVVEAWNLDGPTQLAATLAAYRMDDKQETLRWEAGP